MTVHVVALPHTKTVRDPSWCAFTSQTITFCDMLTSLGHRVVLYAADETDTADTELVTICTGDAPIDWDPTAPHWQAMNTAAVEAIAARHEPGDVVALTAGRCQATIADAFPTVIEPIVGYSGPNPNTHRAFPSQAWRHCVAGAEAGDAARADGRFYDRVIPHAVAPQPYRRDHDGYLLFVGRLEQRKGLDVVGEIAARTGRRVLIAGQGPYPIPDGCEHVGTVGPDLRAELMGGAVALLAPTLYVEPFGLVAVEAMRCGTPVVSTDWGGFCDTVANGVSGYRCNTLAGFLDAIEACGDLDRAEVAGWAARYDPSYISLDYNRWLRDVAAVAAGPGWYAPRE